MLSTWEGLDHVEETFHILAELVERGAPVISGHGVVHGFPESFDLVDPRVVDGLEQQFELGILSQPARDEFGFVNDVVVQNQHDTSSSAIVSAHRIEQL